jgi:hypothetical protein
MPVLCSRRLSNKRILLSWNTCTSCKLANRLHIMLLVIRSLLLWLLTKQVNHTTAFIHYTDIEWEPNWDSMSMKEQEQSGFFVQISKWFQTPSHILKLKKLLYTAQNNRITKELLPTSSKRWVGGSWILNNQDLINVCSRPRLILCPCCPKPWTITTDYLNTLDRWDYLLFLHKFEMLIPPMPS